MSDNKNDIPYIAFESITTRLERTIEKLWVIILVLIVLFVGSNCFWIYYDKQFQDTTVTQEVDTGEGDATVMGIGEIVNYGEDQADGESTAP